MGALRKVAEQAPLARYAQDEVVQLERELGGRLHLVQALTYAKQTKDVRYLLGLIADPEHSTLPLPEILRMGRILPGELVAALASGAELRSQLLAKQQIARRIPVVVGEVMQKAAEYEDNCTECMGTGKITADPTPDAPNPSPQDCSMCRATGRLMFPADGKCRDLALEMAGLTGRGGGVHVAVNQQVAVVGGQSYEGYERMQEAMDQILYGAGAVPPLQPPAESAAVDAEVVQTPEPDAGHG